LGSLSVNEIINQVENYLSGNNFLKALSFKQWIGAKEYKVLELRDKSSWVLRLGKNEEQYIHIHPARKGLHTIRIKGSAWKTALLLSILNDQHKQVELKISEINHLRSLYLDLSPLKPNKPYKNLEEAMKVLKFK
jgi:hypothetical protein